VSASSTPNPARARRTASTIPRNCRFPFPDAYEVS
jgi:hypothetical protein